MKIVIVGGGVMGLMQARELAHKGWQVVLVDKSEFGKEASWAGGGIISPLYPWRYSAPVTALASWSQAYYPNLIQSLEAESDIDPELSRHGLLMLAVEDEQAALNWAEDVEHWLTPIDAGQLYQLEPQLREGLDRGLWMKQVASVRNPRLLKALKRIVAQDPAIECVEVSSVAACRPHSTSPAVVLEDGRRIEADAILFCSGAWTQTLLDLPAIEIAPVKGQMLVFDAPPGLVNRVVLSHGKYVIPRRDGKVVAGSTLEYKGFDKQCTPHARDVLSDAAIELFPALASCAITHHWAGLRPGSPGGVPYIGQVPGHDNVYVNAGHFRNGLVLAPASVRLMTSLLCHDEAPVDPAPYDPARMTNPSQAS